MRTDVLECTEVSMNHLKSEPLFSIYLEWNLLIEQDEDTVFNLDNPPATYHVSPSWSCNLAIVTCSQKDQVVEYDPFSKTSRDLLIITDDRNQFLACCAITGDEILLASLHYSNLREPVTDENCIIEWRLYLFDDHNNYRQTLMTLAMGTSISEEFEIAGFDQILSNCMVGAFKRTRKIKIIKWDQNAQTHAYRASYIDFEVRSNITYLASAMWYHSGHFLVTSEDYKIFHMKTDGKSCEKIAEIALSLLPKAILLNPFIGMKLIWIWQEDENDKDGSACLYQIGHCGQIIGIPSPDIPSIDFEIRSWCILSAENICIINSKGKLCVLKIKVNYCPTNT